jgi:hypothetical protein
MPIQESELRRLISLWLDGALAPTDVRRLEAELQENAESRAVYLDFASLHASLAGDAAARAYVDSLHASAWPASDATTASRAGAIQQPHAARRPPRRTMVLAAATIAVAVLAAAAFWLTRPDAVLAKIVDESADCHWYVEHAAPRPTADLAGGDALRVTSGRLVLRYPQGVDVALHAPAAYQLVSATSARMMLGRLAAHVAKGAEGFSVETPRATVVDLGTEFGVDVNPQGVTDVIVFAGEVDVDFNTDRQGESRRRRLRMGEAVRLEARGTTSRIVSIVNGDYASAASYRAPTREPIIAEVTDNITRDESLNFYEIVHGGMREDARAFVDRIAHEYNGVDERGMPSYLIGGDYVKTFNNDKVNHDIRIEVTVAVPARLFILLDDRLQPPEWLRDGFQNTGDKVGVDVGPFFSKGQWHNKTPPGVGPGESVEDTLSVWAREVKTSGIVRLGATEAPESGPNMYGIVAVPLGRGE